MANLGKACVAESIGTFALCFIGAGAICMTTKMGNAGAGLLGVALAHGIILSIGVSATMNVSGGHLNPAVTCGLLAAGRISGGSAFLYVLSQLVGAILGGLAVFAVFKGFQSPDGASVVKAAALGTPYYGAQISAGNAIFLEAILTFLLVFAVFGTAVDPRAPKIGGFGIGLTIAADILVGGPLTGAAMNPARTFGPGLIASLTGNLGLFWSQQVVYWIGPIIGGIAAGLIYESVIMEKRPATSR